MKTDFRDSLKDNINIKSDDTKGNNILDESAKDSIAATVENTDNIFVLPKKVDDKRGKKAFNVYMDPDMLKELDKISKRSGWSRNEVINKMCEYCIKNIKIEDWLENKNGPDTKVFFC